MAPLLYIYFSNEKFKVFWRSRNDRARRKKIEKSLSRSYPILYLKSSIIWPNFKVHGILPSVFLLVKPFDINDIQNDKKKKKKKKWKADLLENKWLDFTRARSVHFWVP